MELQAVKTTVANRRLHRVFMSVSLTVAGVSSLLAITDPTVLGIPTHAWAFVCFSFSVLGIIINSVRMAWGEDD